MNTVIIIIAIASLLVALFFIVCVVAVAYLMATAPDGYEDDESFHYQ